MIIAPVFFGTAMQCEGRQAPGWDTPWDVVSHPFFAVLCAPVAGCLGYNMMIRYGGTHRRLYPVHVTFFLFLFFFSFLFACTHKQTRWVLFCCKWSSCYCSVCCCFGARWFDWLIWLDGWMDCFIWLDEPTAAQQRRGWGVVVGGGRSLRRRVWLMVAAAIDTVL